MKSVFFKPWVGNDFGKDGSVFSQKILVLGDSHYIDESDEVNMSKNNEEPCDFTTAVLQAYLNQAVKGRWKSTFTKFMNSFVCNTNHSETSREKLWNSVAFYNYLQIPAGSDSRQTHQFSYHDDRDRNAFLEVVNKLEPDIIISWGNNVWDAIPANLGYGNGIVSESVKDCCLIYPFKGKELKLIGITHPSTSYRSSYWANIFDELNANT
ncbi:hypothetical protein [Shewanella gaetbuli]|uniref:Uracil DNA glycosylase superfamily protein n=1 Tax=Shewanella gaetbuli TaxID=220752 RepID=A0A9X1ZNE5_9GAMM|nr:hypothetical protein [Shewanella gaetbuli]MCL1144162.1 hypothetical protein [Shewanella gaetbuli]